MDGLCAVDHRRLVHLLGQPADELHHEENIQKTAAEKRGNGNGQQRIRPAEIDKDLIHGDHRKDARQHDGAHGRGKYDLPSVEFDLCECVRRHRRGQRLTDDVRRKNDHRVAEVF